MTKHGWGGNFQEKMTLLGKAPALCLTIVVRRAGARVLSQSRGFDTQRLLPVMRRLLGEPAEQGANARENAFGCIQS